MKKRKWLCLRCDKIYETECQICPKCNRVMMLSERIGDRKMMMEGKNHDSERM